MIHRKDTTMKTTQKLNLIAAALACALVAPVHAQPAKAAAKQVTVDGVGVMDLTHISASIEAVDVKNRIVTLKGPRGNVFAVAVSDRVKNLAQVKAGDSLEVDYFESVAIELKKADGVPTLTETMAADKAAKGSAPGGMALRKVHIVTSILGINTETQRVLVRGPLGHLTEVKVRDPKLLATMQAGGQIDLTYVEGLALSVQPGAAKK
jgi:hypothetical protein